MSLQEQRIQKTKEIDQNYKDYKGQKIQFKATYILGDIAKEFIIELYKGEI